MGSAWGAEGDERPDTVTLAVPEMVGSSYLIALATPPPDPVRCAPPRRPPLTHCPNRCARRPARCSTGRC